MNQNKWSYLALSHVIALCWGWEAVEMSKGHNLCSIQTKTWQLSSSYMSAEKWVCGEAGGRNLACGLDCILSSWWMLFEIKLLSVKIVMDLDDIWQMLYWNWLICWFWYLLYLWKHFFQVRTRIHYYKQKLCNCLVHLVIWYLSQPKCLLLSVSCLVQMNFKIRSYLHLLSFIVGIGLFKIGTK